MATQLGFQTFFDENAFHLKAIQKFSSAFPYFSLKHYSSVTGPLPYMLWATFGKAFGFEIPTLRFLTVLFSYTTGLLFFVTCRDQKIPFPLLTTFVLISFPYIFLHSFTLYTNNMALFWQVFTMLFLLKYVESKSITDLILAAFGSSALVFTRQIDIALPIAALCFLLTEKNLRRPWTLLIVFLPIAGLLFLFYYWGGIFPGRIWGRPLLHFLFSIRWTQFTLILVMLGFYFHPLGLLEIKRGKGWPLLFLIGSVVYLLIFPLNYPKEGLGIIYYGIDVLGRNVHPALVWILPLYFGIAGGLFFHGLLRGIRESRRPPLVFYIFLCYFLMSGLNPVVYERYDYYLWPMILLLLPKDISENRALLLFVLAIQTVITLAYLNVTLIFPN